MNKPFVHMLTTPLNKYAFDEKEIRDLNRFTEKNDK